MWPVLKKNIGGQGLPIGNYMVLVLIAVVFILQFGYDPSSQALGRLVLHSFSASALLGHMWLHTGLLHLAESLILLWIFGRAVCLKIGSANFFLAYVLVGIAGAIVHCGYDGRAAIGASGAIMGILGMYTVLCFNRLSAAGPWIVLIWFLLSLTCGITGFTDTAHMDHCGGFIAGAVLAVILIYFGKADSDESDPLLRSLALLRIRI
jgi:membrane associated rhomboid family serine protease